jgi:hypothetical protein
MRVLVSDILRRLASAIELDTTPTDKEIEEKRKVTPASSPNIAGKKKLKGDEASSEKIMPTALPKIKPPRRNPSYKPSNWDSKQHRKNYMQEYRAEGKDVENGNKYVKKNR